MAGSWVQSPLVRRMPIKCFFCFVEDKMTITKMCPNKIVVDDIDVNYLCSIDSYICSK